MSTAGASCMRVLRRMLCVALLTARLVCVVDGDEHRMCVVHARAAAHAVCCVADSAAGVCVVDGGEHSRCVVHARAAARAVCCVADCLDWGRMAVRARCVLCCAVMGACAGSSCS